MRSTRALTLFAAYPGACMLLAALLMLAGLVFITGLLPASVNRPYFRGHEWAMAALCWALALFFAYCARVGLQARRQSRRDN